MSFSISLAVSRHRAYQWWLRLWYASTPKFKPLMRADFTDNCLFSQAEFLCRAGYYNASVQMARLAIEKRLKRLVLITPEWQTYRYKGNHGAIIALHQAHAINSQTKHRLEKFCKHANKYVHQTIVQKQAAIKLLCDASLIRSAMDVATSKLLNQ